MEFGVCCPSRHPHQWRDLLQFASQRLLCEFRVVIRLQSEPPAVGKAEEAAEAQIGGGGDAALARYNVADALGGHADALGKPVLAHPQRSQKLLEQYFTG